MSKKAVVLLSGGMDSATTLFMAKERGYKCIALIFDYGQRNRREIKSAKNVAKKAGCPYILAKVTLPRKGSSLLDPRIRIPKGRKRKAIPSTYVPARNTVMLSIALSYAESMRAHYIFIGAHTEDYSGYPDCRPGYFKAFNNVKNIGTKLGTKIKILTPLLNKSKSEIIIKGLQLGVPYRMTWSCYKGGLRPCGECDSCYYRRKGFRKAGVKDPL
ncbi:MAG: 7-cyano-7-deazaguanine synthase QueC [Candidatus Omnitrophica bacterium]|nr:7-cyano-7-deazaguanine synthase QueC [Candidatus Omnitrophota bacterium]